MEVKTKIETYKNTLKGVKRQTEMKKKNMNHLKHFCYVLDIFKKIGKCCHMENGKLPIGEKSNF
jgi:hypothetical protein